MEPIALAQKMELEGKAYYEKLAAETTAPELKGVFTFLAGEEQKHYDLFKSMAFEEPAPPSAEEDAALGKMVEEVFSRLTASFTFPEVVYDYQAAYGKALEMEREAVRFYTEIEAKAEASDRKAVRFIIGQEKMHARLIESLIEFTKNPKTWLENSEWRTIASY